MLKEFKEFAMRGNVVDLAVGLVMGAAFTAIVQSLVNDVVMPPIGRILGRVDFSNLFINLGPGSYATLRAAKEAGAATIAYGLFLNTVVNFVVVAFVMFVLVRQVNRLRRGDQPPPPTTRQCPYCQMTIALKATRCPHCTSDLAPAGGRAT